MLKFWFNILPPTGNKNNQRNYVYYKILNFLADKVPIYTLVF